MPVVLLNSHRFGVPVPPASFETTVLAASPAHYWPMDEGSGTPVDIVAALSTTMTGTLNWSGSGRFGGQTALDFPDSTTNYISITGLGGTGDFSWQYAINLDSTANVMPLVGNTDIGYFSVDSTTRTRIQWSGGSSYVDHVSNPYTTGNWILMHIVRSGTSAHVWINGTNVGFVNVGANSITINRFGRYHSAGFSMDGRMSHIGYWSSAISNGTIADIWAAWSGGTP